MYLLNMNKKKIGIAVLISDKTNFKIRSIIRDRGSLILIIKVLFTQKT